MQCRFWLLPGHLKGAAPGGGDLVDREHGGMVDMVDRDLALFEKIAEATGETLEQVFALNICHDAISLFVSCQRL